MAIRFNTAQELASLLPANQWKPETAGAGILDGLPVGQVATVPGLGVVIRDRGNPQHFSAPTIEPVTVEDVVEGLEFTRALQGVEFEAHVRRFMASHRTHREHLSNFALGIAGESGEVVELIKKHLYHGKPLDTEKLTEEIGGLLWYVQAMCVEGGITIADAMAYNQEQLEARHEGQSFRVDKVDNGKDGGSSGAPAQPFCASYFPELVTTPYPANEEERPVIVKGPPLSSYLTVTDNYGERSKYPGNTGNQFPVGDIGYRSPVAHRAYVKPAVGNVIVNGDYVN